MLPTEAPSHTNTLRAKSPRRCEYSRVRSSFGQRNADLENTAKAKAARRRKEGRVAAGLDCSGIDALGQFGGGGIVRDVLLVDGSCEALPFCKNRSLGCSIWRTNRVCGRNCLLNNCPTWTGLRWRPLMARFRRIIWHISTRHAARALRLTDRSVIAAGKRGDLAVWLVAHPAELARCSDLNPLF
jgi:hypothetical protein